VILLALLAMRVELPPQRFQGDAGAMVQFKTDVTKLCGVSPDPKKRMAACQDGEFIVLPNPCQFAEPYARIVCHEMAHKQGWPADHGD
jgi:hypothetical protein